MQLIYLVGAGARSLAQLQRGGQCSALTECTLFFAHEPWRLTWQLASLTLRRVMPSQWLEVATLGCL